MGILWAKVLVLAVIGGVLAAQASASHVNLKQQVLRKGDGKGDVARER